ncbi:MAG: response regulator [Candidatus Marinimicrobia bacterium]|nr:response regulator [Candidatus Neomarinimicrobiota bacterium]
MANILLVDDDQAVLKSVRMVVNADGHVVQALDDSLAARDFLAGQEPLDLLITDIRMPGLNGLELIEKALTLRPGLPVMVISAFLDDETVEALRDLGCQAYLSKPFQMDDLLAAIHLMLKTPPMAPTAK